MDPISETATVLRRCLLKPVRPKRRHEEAHGLIKPDNRNINVNSI